MSDNTQGSGSAQRRGYDVAVERFISSTPEIVYDAFLDMYGDERPDWIVESQLDLRVGGAWLVTFSPPGVEPFRETRIITDLNPPRRLAYTMTAISSGRSPSFETTVALTFDEQGPRTRVCLEQRGFPTADTRDDFASAWPDVLELLDRRIST